MTAERTAQIQERRTILEQAKARLKAHFIGNDEPIDKIFINLETWWIHPEFLTRPTIVNLVGLTGCGKTDFVRRLSLELDLAEYFCSIEIDNTRTDSYGVSSTRHDEYSIIGRLYASQISPSTQSILLLDDFHRYGQKTMYDDVWKLLSDGRLTDDQIRIQHVMKEIDSVKRHIEKTIEFENRAKVRQPMMPTPTSDPYEAMLRSIENEAPRGYMFYAEKFLDLVSLTNADRLLINMLVIQTWDKKALLKPPLPIPADGTKESLADRNTDVQRLSALNPQGLYYFLNHKLAYIKSQVSDPEKFVYKRLLIFLSFNLDNLFYADGNKQVVELGGSEELWKKTRQIGTKEVKNELLRIFRPEQVSRLGSVYVVFPSLREPDIKELIFRRVKICEEMLLREHKVKTRIPEGKVFMAVREIGIYPDQGTRPITAATDYVLSLVVPKILIAADEILEADKFNDGIRGLDCRLEWI